MGRLEAARMLLDGGADPNARTNATSSRQWGNKTPHDLLAIEDRTGEGGTPVTLEVDAEMAALLVQHGAAR